MAVGYSKQMIGKKDKLWSESIGHMIFDDGFILQHPLSFALTLCMISWLKSMNISISYQSPVFSVEIVYNPSACLTKRYYTSPCVTIRLLHVCGCDKEPYPFFIRQRDYQATHTYTQTHTHTLIPVPQLSDSRGESRFFLLTSCCIREL